jgi:hypothetical protein
LRGPPAFFSGGHISHKQFERQLSWQRHFEANANKQRLECRSK